MNNYYETNETIVIYRWVKAIDKNLYGEKSKNIKIYYGKENKEIVLSGFEMDEFLIHFKQWLKNQKQ